MEPEKKTNGALIGLIIIIIILIAGGIYMWQANKSATEEMPVKMESENTATTDSSELNALEADLQTTDTNTGVDANTVY